MQRYTYFRHVRSRTAGRLLYLGALTALGGMFACSGLQDNRDRLAKDKQGVDTIDTDDASSGGESSSFASGGSSFGNEIGDSTGGNTNMVDGCAELRTRAKLVHNNFLFVVDKSGSMKCNAPPIDNECALPEKKDETQPSKWESTQAALVGLDDPSTTGVDESGAIRSLLGTQGLSAGLLTFPVDDYCGVLEEGEVITEVAELTNEQIEDFASALDVEPDGETPLAGAAIRGLEVLRQRVVDGELVGNSYLVLMTDGVETCQPAALDHLKAFVADALDGFKIHTFVLGAPGSESSRSLLSELAYLGGTATEDDCDHGSEENTAGNCHIDLTESEDFAGDLAEVFTAITTYEQADCDFDIPDTAFVDPDKVQIIFTPSTGEKEVVGSDDGDCATEANGWQYTSDKRNKLVLCGAACERVRADSGGAIDVVFGCQEKVN